MELVASVRLCVGLSVCLSWLNRLSFDLDFWHEGQPLPRLFGIVGQGRRSKVKVSCQKLYFDITVTCDKTRQEEKKEEVTLL